MGDSCTLKVHVQANPPPMISWYRNDEVLNEGGRVKVNKHQEAGKYSLTILQTKPNDFGVYKCVARNKFGTVTSKARMLCGSEFPSVMFRWYFVQLNFSYQYFVLHGVS